MGQNRRYGMNEAPGEQPRIIQVPQQAYGPQEITWADVKPPVWAWVLYDAVPAERVQGFAAGWNDRVVMVEWNTKLGTRQATVWRSAVTKRPDPDR